MESLRRTDSWQRRIVAVSRHLAHAFVKWRLAASGQFTAEFRIERQIVHAQLFGGQQRRTSDSHQPADRAATLDLAELPVAVAGLFVAELSGTVAELLVAELPGAIAGLLSAELSGTVAEFRRK